MGKFVLKRTLMLIPTLLIILTLVFALMRMVPGSPVWGLLEGEEGQYGLYVKSVNGITADEANQEWWCLTKGGEDVMTGVDMTPVEDGAAYEFTLTVGW